VPLILTSPRNPRIAFVRSLQRAAVRHAQGRTYVEGRRVVAQTLAVGRVEFVLYVPANDAVIDALAATARERGCEVIPCSRAAFAAATSTESPQGILAVVATPALAPRAGLRLAVVLDGVQDPGNLGALVRCAAAAGASEVLCTRGGADPFSPKAMRAGAGAQFHIAVTPELGPDELAGRLRSLPLVAATAAGRTAYSDVDWTVAAGVAIGSEAHGVSAAVRALAWDTVRIPMHGMAESLNAASAAAVILFEAARQRAAAGVGEGNVGGRAT